MSRATIIRDIQFQMFRPAISSMAMCSRCNECPARGGYVCTGCLMLELSEYTDMAKAFGYIMTQGRAREATEEMTKLLEESVGDEVAVVPRPSGYCLYSGDVP